MKLYVFFCVSLLLTFRVHSQVIEKRHKILLLGLNYGQSSQNKFPFDSPDYLYDNQYFKIQINYILAQRKKLSYELIIEPGLYYSEHQLLNKYFIQPHRGPDYLEQRERFTKKRTFNEYALNLGIITRYSILNNFSTYLLGSVGPMISGQDTERLKKGFAFSDILGFGFSYKQKHILYDLRLTLRHNSSANLSQPNDGHNSVGIESGISFQLK